MMSHIWWTLPGEHPSVGEAALCGHPYEGEDLRPAPVDLDEDACPGCLEKSGGEIASAASWLVDVDHAGSCRDCGARGYGNQCPPCEAAEQQALREADKEAQHGR